ncbi:ligase-associated DNA damage response DEXH box helicase [Marinoscillum furvescens]|uniref:ATP-dependent Lhr-like helicase n=1 Tax=Marinoscillum furvescens DSM 4134 TaxID=1122208 RepID=A0A3D9L7I4_MARFU|nr:ligase-associated DNA damage response DEXH box helicase [Marinoscillum furvescens]REE01270.1 ATP-dependent Lhr-like helicase [Marinoscillum furvescens DSM 4134]
MNDKLAPAYYWFASKGWRPFPFQEQAWRAYLDGKSGLLNAPTGSGKTYALWMPCLLEHLACHDIAEVTPGVRVLWVTPLRALAKDIQRAMQEVCDDLQLRWAVGLRTGDTTPSQRQAQKKKAPQALVITPESIHVLMSQSDYPNYFKDLSCVIVDEWHELLGTKRGVATELAISRLKALTDNRLKVWGISATIGNLPQARRVLLGEDLYKKGITLQAQIDKQVEVTSVLPDEVEKFPWTGHLGTRLLPKIMPIIEQSKTTLLFTNTRSQTELWYQAILKFAPDLSGVIAMHHGSMDHDIRGWVEDALHAGKLKLVVCTSSLDLGVDFRPVDTVIQVGGPKGVARFFQRAGRSGHQPGSVSKIYFVPTHSLELVEGAALREAIAEGTFESRKPLEKSLDVLVQYLVTLAVSGGFKPLKILQEIKNTYCYRLLTAEEWRWCLEFITTGGKSLGQYDEFAKVYNDDGVYKIINKRAATRHKLSIGTIVGDPALSVKYLSGGHIGTVEESFISRLSPGDTFWFAGKNLEFVRIKDLTVLVRKSSKKSGLTPQWGGGRLPLSNMLADKIRDKLDRAIKGDYTDVEMQTIKPILDLQRQWSIVPPKDQLLIEKTKTRYGFHLFFYSFEGMFVHEVLGGVVALRISRIQPISFSISMNDYGFELLSDQEIPIEEALEYDLFTEDQLMADIQESINMTEMAKRKFRDVATISGLIFQGYPGKGIRAKHLQASSGILYKVFEEYDQDNLLLRQSMEEVLTLQLEHSRLFEAVRRINQQKIVLKETIKPTPFAFPILVDMFRRQNLTSEQLADRIQKMQMQLEKAAGNQ